MSDFKNKVEAIFEIVKSLDNKEQRMLFSLFSKVMQDQVIGYIRVYGNEYCCAVSETETFQPLPSFGTDNGHLPEGRLIRFPDNKNLSDMLKDPLSFTNWLKENNINRCNLIQV